MKSWMKPLLATVIIFGTGLMTGSMLSGTLADQRHPAAQPAQPQKPDQPPAAERPRPSRPHPAASYVNRLSEQLNLTDEQRKQIHEAIKSSAKRLYKVLEPLHPRIQEEMKRRSHEIHESLTDEQKEKFDQLKRQPFRGRPHHRKGGKPDSKKPNPEAERPLESPVQISSPRNA